MISVVIPVKDGGTDLVRCLEAIARQRVDDDVEVVVVDSGSRDGSAGRAHRLGAHVHSIPPTEFHHGRTRNVGAQLAGGEVLVFTSQDAYAAEDRSLARLVSPLRWDDTVAGVYGRQLPHVDARPPERARGASPAAREPRGPELRGHALLERQLRDPTTRLGGVPVRRRRRDERGPGVVATGAAGGHDHRLRARRGRPTLARVHRRGAFRRFFDSGASSDRAYMDDEQRSRQALRAAAARYARGELAWLWRTGQRRWIPYTALYEVAKFGGLQLGRRHRRLPAALRRRFSDYPAYWDE